MANNYMPITIISKYIPVMYIYYIIDDKPITVCVEGNYASWKYIDEHGMESHTIAENLSHPLDIVDLLTKIKVPYSIRTLKLSFSFRPTSYKVLYWPECYAGIRENYYTNYKYSDVMKDDLIIPLGEPGYIFQVQATWSQGEAYYDFYVSKYNTYSIMV